ncbi:MAG TPA: PAS domain S-box protein, partial [Gemmataceae bacterium]|nr:PAS domain S-box protein [Gemmataceae bacterium]
MSKPHQASATGPAGPPDLFRLLVESVKDYAIFTLDPAGNVVGWNLGAERLQGYPAAEAVGLPCSRFYTAEDAAAGTPRRDLDAALARGRYEGEGVRVRKDGSRFWAVVTITALYDPPGKHVGFAQVARDVTERRASEETFRVAFEHTNVAMVLTDAGHRFVRANAAFARLFGYSEGEILGKSMADVTHPDDVGESLARREPLLDGSAAYFQMEKRYIHKDGHVFWGLANVSLARDPAGRPLLYIGQVLDVTERRRLEEQYRQAQKMEAVGRLAGGVAHDFNNLLTVINGYGQIVASALPPGDPNRELVREMTAAGERAAALTRQLLAFSRKQIVDPRVLDLRALLVNLDGLVRRVIGEDIRLVIASDPDLWPVKADPGQVEQLVLNLVVNARDAMPTGGWLTVETRNAELDDGHARRHAEARPGQYVLLAVTDTGCGMDAATQARIFEPFFTTKGEKGTGLGLATVHGVVKQAGGHVAVTSEPGRGSTFEVYLPRTAEGLPAAAAIPGLKVMPRGTETVLLVEDDDGVRSLARHVLRECGYAVLEAADGLQALRIAGQYGGRIDLLATDVIMPDLGGRALAERLTASWPGLKVLYLSGYTDDAVVRHGVLEARVHFLHKPYAPA